MSSSRAPSPDLSSAAASSTGDTLAAQLAGGEGQHVEFKDARIKPADLAQTLVALANADGGSVLLGVDDDGRPLGIPDPGEARDLVLTAASHELCDPPVVLEPLTAVPVSGGKHVLLVRVARSRTLHATHGRFLVRRGSQNVALTTAELAAQAHRLDTGGLTPLQLGSGLVRLYEVLRFDSTLELQDAHGALAVLRRDQTVRFLQDGIVGLYDQAWGDGDLFADYRVRPGVVADRFRLGPRHITLISLREIKNRGDTLHLQIQRTIAHGWPAAEEWLETLVSHRTDRLRLRVVFPAERPPRRVWLVEERSGVGRELTGRHWTGDEQGRTVISWQRRDPPVGDIYLLRWEW